MAEEGHDRYGQAGLPEGDNLTEIRKVVEPTRNHLVQLFQAIGVRPVPALSVPENRPNSTPPMPI